MKLQEEYAQQVTLENWGQVRFLPAVIDTDGKKQLKLYLADAENTVLYRFTDMNQDNVINLKEASFTDVNRDGLVDLIVPAEYEKADASGSYTDCLIYLRSGDEFLPAVSLRKELQTAGMNESIEAVTDYLKDKIRYLTLSDLTAQGFTVFQDKVTTAVIEGWGTVTLVPGYRKGIGVNEFSIFLTDGKGNLLYRLPSTGDRDCFGVSQIVLNDVDSDGQQDILVMASYTTGFKTDGITQVPYVNLFRQQADHTFVNLPEFDKELNYRMKEVTLELAIDTIHRLDTGLE